MYLYLHRGARKDGERLVRSALLDYASRKGLGVPGHNLLELPIAKGEKGKPFFAGLQGPEGAGKPEVHYSVSHSGDFWGCLMAGEPVGFDMEVVRERVNYDKIAKRYFAEEECKLVLSSGLEAFFDVWVRKEAYVKYLGTGLATGLDTFSVAEDGKLLSRVVLTEAAGRGGSSGMAPGIVKPCFIGDGIKAAYCCAGGDPIEAVVSLDEGAGSRDSKDDGSMQFRSGRRLNGSGLGVGFNHGSAGAD